MGDRRGGRTHAGFVAANGAIRAGWLLPRGWYLLPRLGFARAPCNCRATPLLRAELFLRVGELKRTVHTDRCVEVNTNHYSGPWRRIGKRVRARPTRALHTSLAVPGTRGNTTSRDKSTVVQKGRCRADPHALCAPSADGQRRSHDPSVATLRCTLSGPPMNSPCNWPSP
jgi:hypothetical protein